MPQLTRWGFDRVGGCKVRPAILIRRLAQRPGRDAAETAAKPPLRVRNIETATPDFMTADRAGGCEGRAPAGTSGAGVAVAKVAANARQPRNLSRPEKIDLADAPSGMEAQAERWQRPLPSPPKSQARGPAPSGRAFCRCGGKTGGYVPDWFGRDCIEQHCPLKGAA